MPQQKNKSSQLGREGREDFREPARLPALGQASPFSGNRRTQLDRKGTAG